MCSRKCWIVNFFYFFFTFLIEAIFSDGRFWTATLPHPSPNCHQSQKLEFCSYFCPKKCPSFACTFTKMSLSEGFGTLPFQIFLWTIPSDSYWFFKIFHVRLGEKSKNVSFSRVYVCVKAKLKLFVFLLLFFAPSPNFKIQLQNPFQTSASKSWSNLVTVTTSRSIFDSQSHISRISSTAASDWMSHFQV